MAQAPAKNTANSSANPSEIKPLPIIPLVPLDEFLDGTKIIEAVPRDDPSLSYRVRLPMDWAEVPRDTTGAFSGIFEELARYVSPFGPGGRSQFMIYNYPLDKLMSTEHWFIDYLRRNGYSPQGLSVNSNGSAEALYVEVLGDQEYIVRMRAYINGQNVIVGLHRVPTQAWESMKTTQNSIVTSFTPISDYRNNKDALEDYSFLGITSFFYPKTWVLKEQENIDPSRLRVVLESTQSERLSTGSNKRRNLINGQVDVHLVTRNSKTKLADEIERVSKSLEDLDFTIGSKKSAAEEEVQVKPGTTKSKIEIYMAKDNQRKRLDHEFWLGIIATPDHYIFVSMLTPDQSTDFMNWAHNKETFRIILESLTI